MKRLIIVALCATALISSLVEAKTVKAKDLAVELAKISNPGINTCDSCELSLNGCVQCCGSPLQCPVMGQPQTGVSAPVQLGRYTL